MRLFWGKVELAVPLQDLIYKRRGDVVCSIEHIRACGLCMSIPVYWVDTCLSLLRCHPQSYAYYRVLILWTLLVIIVVNLWNLTPVATYPISRAKRVRYTAPVATTTLIHLSSTYAGTLRAGIRQTRIVLRESPWQLKQTSPDITMYPGLLDRD